MALEIGGARGYHLNVARDLKEGESFRGDFGLSATKEAQSGKIYQYVVVRTNHAPDGEYLIFPRNIICKEKITPDTETRPATFTRRGGNLQVTF